MRKRSWTRTAISSAGAVMVVCGTAAIAAAQNAPPPPTPAAPGASAAPSAPAATVKAAPQATAATESDPQAIFRAPLIREGSAVIEAKAHIRKNARGWWEL